MSAAMIAAIVSVLLLTIIVPLGVMAFLHRRGGTWQTFLTGAAAFTIFAMVLESIFHNLALYAGIIPALQGNIWLYGLYGGLAAGIFEETGRFLAFRLVLKDRHDRVTALSYGIGHGGAEAFLLLGLTMAGNLVLGQAYISGAAVPEELIPSIEALIATSPVMFLWAGFERLTAMILHLALSVLVYAAVQTKRWQLFPAAILLHAAADLIAVISNATLPIAATEALVMLVSILTAVWAVRIYKKLPKITKTP